MKLEKLENLIEIAKSKEIKKLVVAAAEDKHVLEAVMIATKQNIVKPILVGNCELIAEISKEIGFEIKDIEIIDEKNPVESCNKAALIIKEGRGDILMKGLVGTASLLKAVLKKENGLRKRDLLSHVALFESPNYHKLFGVTDAAMNIAPTMEEKVKIIDNSVELFNKLGVKTPKVAIIAAVEVVNRKMTPSIDGALLSVMNRRGQIKNCIVDGPLALDNAISKEAAKHKKIVSDVAGDADILVTPNIESGNVLYKTLNFLGGAVSAAVLMGANIPIVLTSRADSEQSKLYSIALSAAL